MLWIKNGMVYVANGDNHWAQSHAYLPTPLLIDEKRIRVFLSFRDVSGIGRVGYVDVSAQDPRLVLNVSKSPVLDVGKLGTFDDHGVTPISVIKEGNKLYMFYTGWQLGVTVPYYMFTGIAVSEDGGETFQRLSRVPVLDRSDEEPLTRTAAHVRKEGNCWHMWYVAGDNWINVEDKMMPSYDIRHLTSESITQWGNHGHVCLAPDNFDEFGLGRPFIFKSQKNYQLFYSIRTKSRGYYLGYAESVDGLNWVRKDKDVGIDISESGWDSNMICFAAIQSTQYNTYMFYNGNNYGETGFGVATLANEKDSFSR